MIQPTKVIIGSEQFDSVEEATECREDVFGRVISGSSPAISIMQNGESK